MTLLKLYRGLESASPAPGTDYVVAPTSVGRIYVGKGPDGEAALIIENTSALQAQQVRIVLAAFMAHRNRRVVLTGVSENVVGALTIEVSDPELIPRFYELCSLLVADHEAGNESETWRFVETMARIFRAETLPGRTEVVGFLGELLYIYASSSRNGAIEAWQNSGIGRFDFQYETYRLDVKTTSLAGRRHVLALEQVSAVAGELPFLASVQLREGGRNDVDSLLREIAYDPSLTSTSRIRFEERVAVSLGTGRDAAGGFTFDLEAALSSIRIFRADEVPRIAEVPAGVTRVQFMSDFDFAVRSLSLRDFEGARAGWSDVTRRATE